MYRILVALLAALDALVTVAMGLALALVPLTVLFLFGIGEPEWGALWPATAAVFQLGNLVPLTVQLPAEYVTAVGIDPAGASFVVSLAPLVFALVTAVMAWRSATRAMRSGAAVTGLVTGVGVFAVAVSVVAVTAAHPVVSAPLALAIVLPTLVYAIPGLAGAATVAWREGDEGPIDVVRARVDAWGPRWHDVPGAAALGVVVSTLGLLSVGALMLVVALVARGGSVIALFQASAVDVWGALTFAVVQFAYLPTLLVWGMSFAAGPGFALGADTVVSPAVTQLGVVPGVPILGAVPDASSPWLLVLVLLPVAVGALAGWLVRIALPALPGDPLAPRLVAAVATAAGAAGVAAVLALLAAGSLGPGRLSAVGPDPGPVALAVGLEVLVGAGILLLSPRQEGHAEPR